MSAPTREARAQRLWDVAAATPDPELPVVTIAELGILRDVVDGVDGTEVIITPTYSGCPAMREISADVTRRLRAAGCAEVRVRFRLSPPWTTDWISDDGRAALRDAGIAPPAAAPSGPVLLTLTTAQRGPSCPHCGSADTVRTADFSGTACKALHRCRACREPFEAVKAI